MRPTFSRFHRSISLSFVDIASFSFCSCRLLFNFLSQSSLTSSGALISSNTVGPTTCEKRGLCVNRCVQFLLLCGLNSDNMCQFNGPPGKSVTAGVFLLRFSYFRGINETKKTFVLPALLKENFHSKNDPFP